MVTNSNENKTGKDIKKLTAIFLLLFISSVNSGFCGEKLKEESNKLNYVNLDLFGLLTCMR